MRYVSDEKPALCPHCGAARVVPIAYGDPVLDPDTMFSDDRPVFGGCTVNRLRDPSWACRSCGTQIHRKPLREEPDAPR